MDRTELRIETGIAGGGAVVVVVFFWAVYGPALLTLPPGATIRAMALLPLAALAFGHVWWLACVVMGVRQLFSRPRWYGLVTLGVGAAQFVAVPLAMWLLMRARGIGWGS